MSIHIQYNTATIRWYAEGKSFDNQDPYECVAVMNIVGPQAVYLHSMHGKITKAMLNELADKLVEMGIHYVLATRKGKLVQREVHKYYSGVAERPNAPVC